MLVLPEDIGLYADVISRWESITLNLVNEKAWNDNKSKVMYIENLLGEIEKKLFIQWRMAYPNDYEELVKIADDPQNVTSHIRHMFYLRIHTKVQQKNKIKPTEIWRGLTVLAWPT